MHLVGFTIEIYYDARPYERQNYTPNSTEYKPSSEANSCSSYQQIPHLLKNPKVHSHLDNPPVRHHEQHNPAHIIPNCTIKKKKIRLGINIRFILAYCSL